MSGVQCMAQPAVEVGRCGPRGAAPRVRARGTRVWPTGPASACGFVVHCCWMRLALAVQLVLRYSGVSPGWRTDVLHITRKWLPTPT